MAASDISMCIHHLDRRGMRHDGWKDNNPETCVRCVTGKYPDWELPGEIEPGYEHEELEAHIARLMEAQNETKV